MSKWFPRFWRNSSGSKNPSPSSSPRSSVSDESVMEPVEIPEHMKLLAASMKKILEKRYPGNPIKVELEYNNWLKQFAKRFFGRRRRSKRKISKRRKINKRRKVSKKRSKCRSKRKN